MKKHLYFIPGTAANSKIFDRIQLPENLVQTHCVHWILPKNSNETIQSYCRRLTSQIKHKNPVLVGVSFGGIIAQELAKIIPHEQVIIISSIKSKHELSPQLKFIKKWHLHRLAPIHLIPLTEWLLVKASKKKLQKQLEAYKTYLSFRAPLYLRWAIKNVLFWEQEKNAEKLIHIHGDNDFIFPLQHIKKDITIANGTHLMIVTQATIISKILLEKLK